MKRALLGLALMVCLLPSPAGAKCIYNGYSTVACAPYVDGNVVVQGSSYNPGDSTVERGARVLFQNFDSLLHTVTVESEACRATTLGQSCDQWFDITLPANARLQTARIVYTNYLAPGTYAYYCKIHSPSPGQGMTGVLHVVTL